MTSNNVSSPTANETVYNEPDQVDAVPEHDPAEDPKDLPEDDLGDDLLDAELDDLDDDDLADAIDDLILGDMLDDMGDGEPEDFVEETTTADGHHIRKEVH